MPYYQFQQLVDDWIEDINAQKEQRKKQEEEQRKSQQQYTRNNNFNGIKPPSFTMPKW